MTSRGPAAGRHALRSAGPAILLAAGFALALLGTAPRPVEASPFDRFYANFQGAELMRAVNAERVVLGIPALRADPRVAAVARDRALPCPSNPDLTIRGRARDLAERDYLSHDVKGCQTADGGTFGTFDLLRAFGQTWSTVGETIASNNYPASKEGHRTGCDQGGGGCAGRIELPWSVATVVRGWMDSPGHRAVMLSGTFTRFGCGAWDGSDGRHAFACFFVAGGPAAIDRRGPAIRARSGDGATFPAGSRPAVSAVVDDAASLLAQARVSLDGRLIRQWTYDHAGSSDALSVTLPRLRPGRHVLTWWVRDTSMNTRTANVRFDVPDGDPAPRPPSAGEKPQSAAGPSLDPGHGPTLPATGLDPTPAASADPGPAAVAALRSLGPTQAGAVAAGAVERAGTTPGGDAATASAVFGWAALGAMLAVLLALTARLETSRRRGARRRPD